MILVIIEDDETIIDTIKLTFQIGWPDAKILSAQTGKAGLSMIESQNPDAVILDLGLPDMSGFDVLKHIRLFSIVPIIVLTVRSDEKDVIRALEMGADEFITKPFRQLELLARIKATIRSRHPDNLQAEVIGSFQFDVSGRRVFHEGKQINLTSTEYIILRYLLVNRGSIVTHKQLAQQIWDSYYPEYSNAIRVYISHLRKKLMSSLGESGAIVSYPGVGYSIPREIAE